MARVNDSQNTSPLEQPSSQAAVEVLLILLVFFLYAGWLPPDVNEAHYLTKAKHYWQPDWCAGDLFLESAKAHLMFYWTLGWLTLGLPLPAVAWIGRLVTWLGLAWAWQRLSFALVPRAWIAVLSASLVVLLTRRFHMAGEWLIGGVEAKGLAYVLVLFALDAMVRNRWRRVWLFLGGATSLHVLVGGWAWVGAACAWIACGRYRPPLKAIAPAIAAGLLLALPGVLIGLSLSWNVDPETLRNANYIYVFRRLPHHLVFHEFPHAFIARHALLLGIWLVASCLSPCRMTACQLGQRPLRGFVGGAVVLALIGIVIDQSLLHHLFLAASLLKYYWFRSSDVFLAVGAAMALVGLVHRGWDQRPVAAPDVTGSGGGEHSGGGGQNNPVVNPANSGKFCGFRRQGLTSKTAAKTLLVGLTLVAAADLLWTQYERRRDLRPGADRQMLPSWEHDPQRTQQKYADWRAVCEWIAHHTPPDALFITPRHQQTFKWHAQRAEVFAWKDVPQDPESVMEWWDRLRELYPRAVVRHGLVRHGEERLLELANEYGAHYVVLDRDFSRRALRWPRVFPPPADGMNSYQVYRVPEGEPDPKEPQ